jgi:hypothetical protein
MQLSDYPDKVVKHRPDRCDGSVVVTGMTGRGSRPPDRLPIAPRTGVPASFISCASFPTHSRSPPRTCHVENTWSSGR